MKYIATYHKLHIHKLEDALVEQMLIAADEYWLMLTEPD